jgi:ribosome-binding protein aMBF1 (putative translation factor)
LPRDPEETQRAVERLGARVQEILANTGMSEEQLAELFRLRSPQS